MEILEISEIFYTGLANRALRLGFIHVRCHKRDIRATYFQLALLVPLMCAFCFFPIFVNSNDTPTHIHRHWCAL